MPELEIAARRLPRWARDLLLAMAMLGGCFAWAGLVHLCKIEGWTVLMWITGIAGLAYCAFVLAALVGYLLYSLDQEVRRGLRR